MVMFNKRIYKRIYVLSSSPLLQVALAAAHDAGHEGV